MLLLLVLSMFQQLSAQPTGHQKLYLQITDQGQVIHFEEKFNLRKIKPLFTVKCGHYQISDISDQLSGFANFSRSQYFHKSLYAKYHRLLIVKNKKDSMVVDIVNLFDVSFLHVPFKKGKFKLIVLDRKLYEWDLKVSPTRTIGVEQIVYDVTPVDWMLQDSSGKMMKYSHYLSFLEGSENKSNLPRLKAENPAPVLPKIPGKVEYRDFNLDSLMDYRLLVDSDQNKWDYYIFNASTKYFEKDSLMSCLNMQYNRALNTGIGYISYRTDELTTQTDVYELRNGHLVWTSCSICVNAFRFSERIDCTFYDVIDGVLIFNKFIRGPE